MKSVQFSLHLAFSENQSNAESSLTQEAGRWLFTDWDMGSKDEIAYKSLNLIKR